MLHYASKDQHEAGERAPQVSLANLLRAGGDHLFRLRCRADITCARNAVTAPSSKIPYSSTSIRNAVTATPAFLRRPGTGHICNSQTIRYIQNSGVSAIPLKQGTCYTLLLHSADNQYITKYPVPGLRKKLPTIQHYERPATSPVSATTLPAGGP